MPYPGVGFPIPPFEWPHVGRQWPEYNLDSPQAEGLVAWWPTLASRGAGALFDLVKGNSGVFNGGLAWVSDGQHGPALDYDGNANTYVQPDLTIQDSDAFTIATWIYPRANTTGYFQRSQAGWDNDSICLRIDTNTDLRHRIVTSAPLADLSSPAGLTLTLNAWNHCVGIWWPGQYLRAILDGLQIATTATGNTGLRTATLERIGATEYVGQRWFNGFIADFRIYNIAKTDAQAYQMYANPWELHRPKTRRLWVLAPGAPAADAMPMAMDLYGRWRRV